MLAESEAGIDTMEGKARRFAKINQDTAGLEGGCTHRCCFAVEHIVLALWEFGRAAMVSVHDVHIAQVGRAVPYHRRQGTSDAQQARQ